MPSLYFSPVFCLNHLSLWHQMTQFFQMIVSVGIVHAQQQILQICINIDSICFCRFGNTIYSCRCRNLLQVYLQRASSCDQLCMGGSHFRRHYYKCRICRPELHFIYILFAILKSSQHRKQSIFLIRNKNHSPIKYLFQLWCQLNHISIRKKLRQCNAKAITNAFKSFDRRNIISLKNICKSRL